MSLALPVSHHQWNVHKDRCTQQAGQYYTHQQDGRFAPQWPSTPSGHCWIGFHAAKLVSHCWKQSHVIPLLQCALHGRSSLLECLCGAGAI